MSASPSPASADTLEAARRVLAQRRDAGWTKAGVVVLALTIASALVYFYLRIAAF